MAKTMAPLRNPGPERPPPCRMRVKTEVKTREETKLMAAAAR